jgi:hypothetical protein
MTSLTPQADIWGNFYGKRDRASAGRYPTEWVVRTLAWRLKTFHGGVVIAISPARHRGHHAKLIEQFPVFMRAILASPVGMMDQPTGWAFRRNATKQGLADQFFGHALAHGVAHQVAAEQVFVACQI